MDAARGFRGYLLPLGLLALLAILASLQYRWTGQISAAERERMQASVRFSTFRFSRDVNEELIGLFRAFRLESHRELEESLQARLDRWKSESTFPDLVDRIYVFQPDKGERDLLALRDGKLVPVAWPTELAPLRERVEAVAEGGEDGPRRRRPPMPMLSDHPPGFGVPIGSPRDGWSGSTPPGYVLVLVDEDVLKNRVLRELETRHFGPDFDVVILDREDDVFFASSEVDVPTLVASADIEAPLFSPRSFFGESPPPQGSGAPPEFGARARRRPPPGFRPPYGDAGRETAFTEGGWRVFVRHRAGSLDAAVAKARFRNLAVSFAVMGLLAASVILVSVSSRRATELSERKMEFVAGVSHELRTPVAVIRSAGQNLADGSVTEPSRVAHYGRVIEAEGRRLEDLLEQILELAGIQSLKRRYQSVPVSAREIVSRAIADCEYLAREGNVEVAFPGSEPDLQVRGDPEALRRAVANLVSNAIKHGGQAGGVEVHIFGLPERRVAIRVVDHGPGIPSQERAHLFDAFYRGSRARERQIKGSGLGLSLVDHIAREHGGAVEVASSPGGGASFTLTLPGAEEEA